MMVTQMFSLAKPSQLNTFVYLQKPSDMSLSYRIHNHHQSNSKCCSRCRVASKAAKPRPLSDIWENTCSTDPLSPPTMNLTGLFGNAGDSKTSLWLPSSLLSKPNLPKGPDDKTTVEGGWPSLAANPSENGPFPSFSTEKGVNWENLTQSTTSNSCNWTPSAIGTLSSMPAQWALWMQTRPIKILVCSPNQCQLDQ
uniref:Uncharacterized protein n=1 Tax=Ditylenchus dipsaci TaxID=166011 RepID=A0A915DU39_9BILA